MVKWKQELGGKEEGQWGVKGKSEVHGRVTEVLMIENVKKTYLPLSLSFSRTHKNEWEEKIRGEQSASLLC